MKPEDLSHPKRFRKVYAAGRFADNGKATTPARLPSATNTCQTWTERQVLKLARLRDTGE